MPQNLRVNPLLTSNHQRVVSNFTLLLPKTLHDVTLFKLILSQNCPNKIEDYELKQEVSMSC